MASRCSFGVLASMRIWQSGQLMAVDPPVGGFRFLAVCAVHPGVLFCQTAFPSFNLSIRSKNPTAFNSLYLPSMNLECALCGVGHLRQFVDDGFGVERVL